MTVIISPALQFYCRHFKLLSTLGLSPVDWTCVLFCLSTSYMKNQTNKQTDSFGEQVWNRLLDIFTDNQTLQSTSVFIRSFSCYIRSNRPGIILRCLSPLLIFFFPMPSMNYHNTVKMKFSLVLFPSFSKQQIME